tara:strand:+ start:1469 stop:1630 length:162 start_codon:yes stop_codon:yes gene_type:complete
MEEYIVVSVPESIDFGTIILPTNPMAYRKAIRKTKYATIPYNKMIDFFIIYCF